MPPNSDETGARSVGDTEREKLVEVMALIDEIEHRTAKMGNDQMMSVGPFLSDIGELRSELVARGKGYQIIPEQAHVGLIRHEASELEVSVRSVDTDMDR